LATSFTPHILLFALANDLVHLRRLRSITNRGGPMRVRVGAILSVVLIAAATYLSNPASATVRIVNDAGGQIGPYLESLVALRSSGERVIMEGPCLSACTMVLGVIPHDRICMTSRARLGFHAAWHPGTNGQQVMSQGGTQLLMNVYPQHVRQWIASRGGL